MVSLGKFGTPHEPAEPDSDVEPISFDYFDATIRLASEYNQVQLVDLMESARSIDMRDPTAMVIVKDTLRLFIDDADFGTFWRSAKENNQTIEELAAVMQGLLSTVTDRPTQQPPASSPGRLPTDENSPAASPTPASAGRPDLQLLLDQGAADRAKIAAAAMGG